MKLIDIITKLDPFTPFWINTPGDDEVEGDCVFCPNKREAALDNMILKSEVEYITLDGEGTLTIEINF